MKKKLKDCTYSEISKLCASKKYCVECPLKTNAINSRDKYKNVCELLPRNLLDKHLNIEIELSIPE